MLSAKNGNGGILYLSAAWVTCENRDNYLFFLLSMKAMGFNITDIPFMSGKGHFLAAVKYLEQHNNTIVTVKFCLEHIIRNVLHKLNINKTKEAYLIRNAIVNLSSANTYQRFYQSIKKLRSLILLMGLIC